MSTVESPNRPSHRCITLLRSFPFLDPGLRTFTREWWANHPAIWFNMYARAPFGPPVGGHDLTRWKEVDVELHFPPEPEHSRSWIYSRASGRVISSSHSRQILFVDLRLILVIVQIGHQLQYFATGFELIIRSSLDEIRQASACT